MSKLTRLDIRIREIGLEHCKDYPNIDSQDSYGYLWAIEQTLEGIKLANEELHNKILYLEKEAKKSQEFLDLL